MESDPESISAVAEFRDDAAAFCTFIDAWRAGSVTAPYTTLLRILSSIAKSAAVLPWDSPRGELDRSGRMDHVTWTHIASEIASASAPAFEAQVALYPDDDPALDRVLMLWDDLADIYRDLRDGLDLYATADSESMAEAVWVWKSGYEHHWGEHLFRALLTIHEIRYRLLIE